MTPLFFLLPALASAAFTDKQGVTYVGTKVNEETAQICIYAKGISSTTWVGFGVHPTVKQGKYDMMGSDLTIVFPSGSGNGVTIKHGFGVPDPADMVHPTFKEDSKTDTQTALSSLSSK
jgi:hypothetical protein